MDPLSIAAGVAGLATFGTQLVNDVYAFVQGIRDAPDDVKHLADDLEALVSIIGKLHAALQKSSKDQEIFPSEVQDDTRKVIDGCYTVFQRLSDLVEEYKDVNTSFRCRFRWNQFGREEASSLHEMLRANQTTLGLSLQYATILIITSVDRKVHGNQADLKKLIVMMKDVRRKLDGHHAESKGIPPEMQHTLSQFLQSASTVAGSSGSSAATSVTPSTKLPSKKPAKMATKANTLATGCAITPDASSVQSPAEKPVKKAKRVSTSMSATSDTESVKLPMKKPSKMATKANISARGDASSPNTLVNESPEEEPAKKAKRVSISVAATGDHQGPKKLPVGKPIVKSAVVGTPPINSATPPHPPGNKSPEEKLAMKMKKANTSNAATGDHQGPKKLPAGKPIVKSAVVGTPLTSGATPPDPPGNKSPEEKLAKKMKKANTSNAATGDHQVPKKFPVEKAAVKPIVTDIPPRVNETAHDPPRSTSPKDKPSHKAKQASSFKNPPAADKRTQDGGMSSIKAKKAASTVQQNKPAPPDIANAVNDSGDPEALFRQGQLRYKQEKFAEAENLYRKALSASVQQGSVQDENASAILYELGQSLTKQGKLEEAAKMYRRQLAAFKINRTLESEVASNTAHNLATIYQSQHKWNEAEDAYKLALTGYEKSIAASKHSSTRRTIKALFELYTNQQKISDAEGFYDQVISAYRKIGAYESEACLTTMSRLGSHYCSHQKYSEAEVIYEEMLAVYKKIGALENEKALSTMNDLGSVYRAQTRHIDAQLIFQRALDGYKKTCGLENEAALRPARNLGLTYESLGKFEDAEKAFIDALVRRKKVLGAKHIKTLKVIEDLKHLRKDMNSQKEGP